MWSLFSKKLHQSFSAGELWRYDLGGLKYSATHLLCCIAKRFLSYIWFDLIQWLMLPEILSLLTFSVPILTSVPFSNRSSFFIFYLWKMVVSFIWCSNVAHISMHWPVIVQCNTWQMWQSSLHVGPVYFVITIQNFGPDSCSDYTDYHSRNN